MSGLYEDLKKRARKLWKDKNLLAERVIIKAKVLSTEEAIGNPEEDDFPIQKGRERLMQADFLGSYGQAFTDRYGDFEGKLGDVLIMPLNNNFRRAIFVSALNAVMRHLGHVEKTVHCHDQQPAKCAEGLSEFVKQHYNHPKVALVGFQPRMVETLGKEFNLRVLDLDQDNIGSEKSGITVEGPEKTEEVKKWADLLVVTGTTIVNGTIQDFTGEKPVIFYGTTIAGAAYLMGWDRFCAYGR